VTKLVDVGMVEMVIRQTLAPLRLEVVQFDAELAYQTGLLRTLTRQAGLSLGDRACLVLAQHLALPALTADRA
jgi:ribonuclease VapC